jgi:cytosine/adenosine deaminase-related metal-dependent hydrolase
MPEEAKKEMRTARNLGVPLVTLHIHNFGEFRLVPFLDEAGLLDRTVHLSHANGVTPEEFEILRRHGVAVTGTPETETGEFPSFGKARAAGVPVGLGMDTVNAVGSDMFTPMRLTFYLQRSRELELAHQKGEEPVYSAGTRDLLEATTLGGAKAIKSDSRVGSISPGKQADLVLYASNSLNLLPVTDPAATIVFQANVGDIDSVWVAGRRVKRDGKLVGIDGPAIARDLDRARDRILEQASRVDIVGDVRLQ